VVVRPQFNANFLIHYLFKKLCCQISAAFAGPNMILEPRFSKAPAKISTPDPDFQRRFKNF
ncbi:MAG: hypothetical protein L6Q97_01365, partial [Thermoanaerobaculia bacterium]|nr:hypothetical protein [Thermoanaerobaculia bacterium]